MMRTLRLTEYVPSDPISLTVAERDGLRGLIPGLIVQPEAGSTDHYVLTTASTVGVARVGDLTIELMPKVGLASVLFLISYAMDARSWKVPDAPLDRDANLAEALVPLFCRAAQRAVRRGLLQGYRREEDALATVRGRVRIADQFRRTGLLIPVEVVYDDFTADILENQLLRTAVDTLGQLYLRDASSRRSLALLEQQLRGISRLVINGRPIPEPQWTRLNEHYRPAASLARLIVSRAGLEARAGGKDASVFLVDMNAVFERFIRVALREQLHLDQRSFPPSARGWWVYLDQERNIPLEPDLSWWINGRCIFVGDCKYKRSSGSVPNADVYQMLAYLTALGLDEGLLIYAAGENTSHGVTIQQAGKRIHVRILDVSKPQLEVMHQVQHLARLVRVIATPARSARDARSLPSGLRFDRASSVSVI